MKDNKNFISVCNESTGEWLGYLNSEEYKLFNDNRSVKTKLNDNKKKSKEIFKTFVDEKLGEFYFNHYGKLMDKKYLFRYMFLCSYMNYKNYIEYGASKHENKLVRKKDLFEIFVALSESEVYRTISYFEKEEMIIYDKDGHIKINNKFCVKGKISEKDVKGVARVFISAIREMYFRSLPRQHKKLEIFIKILPYLHYDYNVLCTNINEESISKINKFNLTTLTKLLGYSSIQRLKNNLFELEIGGESLIMISKIKDIDMIFVNPKFTYKGNKIEHIEGIVTQFELAKIKSNFNLQI